MLKILGEHRPLGPPGYDCTPFLSMLTISS